VQFRRSMEIANKHITLSNTGNFRAILRWWVKVRKKVGCG